MRGNGVWLLLLGNPTEGDPMNCILLTWLSVFVLLPSDKPKPQVPTYEDGRVEPMRTFECAPFVRAPVKAVNVREGDRVKKGDVLIEQDVRVAREEVQTQEAAVASAEASFLAIETTYKRVMALGSAESAETRLRAKFTRDRLEAELRKARSELERLRLMLEYHTHRAPFDGVVLSVTTAPGRVDAPDGGGTVWIRVLDDSVLLIRCNLHLEQLEDAQKHVGTNVEISQGSRKWTGRVSMGAVADPETGEIPLFIEVANPDRTLRCWSKVKVSFPSKHLLKE